MATKRENRPEDGNKPQFINYSLNKQEKAELKKLVEAGDFARYWERIEVLVREKYNVSIKFDAYNDCISAFITPQDPKSPNAGCILTGRANDAYSALFAALYRHFDIFQGVWPVEATNKRELDI